MRKKQSESSNKPVCLDTATPKVLVLLQISQQLETIASYLKVLTEGDTPKKGKDK